jgi:hypothetical protein
LGGTEGCEQYPNDSIEDCVPNVIRPDAPGLQNILLHQQRQLMYLRFMTIFAGERIIDQRGAILAHAALTVLAKPYCRFIGMVITDQFIHR